MNYPYHRLTDDQLFDLLKLNMNSIAGAMTELLGDEGRLPDPRETAHFLNQMEVGEFMQSVQDLSVSLRRTMDLQEMLAAITTENVEIQKEFLKRV